MDFINKKYFLLFSLLFCLGARIKNEISFPLLDSDYATQIEAAKNFSEGHGFSNQVVEIENISVKKYVPLKKWAIGYPIAVWVCHFFTPDWIWAQVLLQVFAVILFIFSFKKLMEYFSVSPGVQGLIFIWMAVSPTPFFYLGTSDLLTTGLFLFSIYYLLRGLEHKRAAFFYFAMTILLSFFSAALRFACIPNLIVLPFFLFLLFIFQKKRKILFPSISIFILSGLLTYIFYKIFPIDSSRTNFVEKLVHFDLMYKHMEWFDPFSLKSFIFTRPLEFRFPNNHIFLLAYRIGMLFLSFLFLFFLLRYFVKREKSKGWIDLFRNDSPSAKLYQLFICSFLVIVSFISLQTLTVPMENNSFGPPWMPPLWTHVYSTRYFIWIIALIILMGAVWLNDKLAKDGIVKFRPIKFPSMIYLAVLGYSFLYFVFINYQLHSSKGNGGGSEWNNCKDEFTMIKLMDDDLSTDASANVVSSSYIRAEYTSPILLLGKGSYCMNYREISAGNFNFTSGNNILYLLVPKELKMSVDSKIFEKGDLLFERELAQGKLLKFKLK